MFGRVGTFYGAPERVDDDVTQQVREQTLRTLKTIPGFVALYVLADRQSGKTIAISLWETEAAAQAWEQMRGPVVADNQATTGRTEQESGRYEVVFSSKTDRTPAAVRT